MHKIILTAAIILMTQVLIPTQSNADAAYLAKRTAEINKQAVAVISNTCHTVWWTYHRATFPAAFASSDGLDGDATRNKPVICWEVTSRTQSSAEQTALLACNRVAIRRHMPGCKLVGSHP